MIRTAIVSALEIFGIAAIITFFVALLIKGVFHIVRFVGRKAPK